MTRPLLSSRERPERFFVIDTRRGTEIESHHHSLVAHTRLQGAAPDVLGRPADDPVPARQHVPAGRGPADAHRQRCPRWRNRWRRSSTCPSRRRPLTTSSSTRTTRSRRYLRSMYCNPLLSPSRTPSWCMITGKTATKRPEQPCPDDHPGMGRQQPCQRHGARLHRRPLRSWRRGDHAGGRCQLHRLTRARPAPSGRRPRRCLSTMAATNSAPPVSSASKRRPGPFRTDFPTPDPGYQLANMMTVFPESGSQSRWGTDFILPVGVNTDTEIGLNN